MARTISDSFKSPYWPNCTTFSFYLFSLFLLSILICCNDIYLLDLAVGAYKILLDSVQDEVIYEYKK